MANQFRIRRKVATPTFVENGSDTRDLSRGYDYESVLIRITGQVQVTTAFIGVLAEAPTQLIQRVELVADGKNTIASIPFNFLVNGDFSRTRNGVMTPPSSGAVATYQFAAEGVLDFATVDGLRPKDTNFRSAGLSMLQLRLTYGSGKSMFYGAGVCTLSNVSIDVISSEMVELPDPKTGKVTSPIALKKVSYQDINIAAANANMRVPLPVGNLLRGVVIRTEQDGVPNDVTLNNVQLTSGVDVRVNVPATDLKAINKLDYGQAIPIGFYVADVMSGGAQTGAKLADAWDLRGASEATLVLDVNSPAPATAYAGSPGVNKVTVETIEYVMVQ